MHLRCLNTCDTQKSALAQHNQDEHRMNTMKENDFTIEIIDRNLSCINNDCSEARMIQNANPLLNRRWEKIDWI